MGYKLKAAGKVCMEERSGDVGVGTMKSDDTSLEKCAQYCKSVSNTFLYGRNNRAGDCYCQAGTRESGRCVLQEDAKDVIQKIIPEVSTTIVEENISNQPKGCIVK